MFGLFLSIMLQTSSVPSAPVLDRAEGRWALDPAETEQRGRFTCEDDPLVISIDKQAMRYRAVTSSSSDDADILTVGESFFVLRYDGEERLDENGQPLIWLFYLIDDDHFAWLRDDQVKKQNFGRTALRMRCPTDGS